MNLGDGLKLETQILDGKTKLILAPYGAQAKGSKQTGNKARTQKTALKTKQPGHVLRSVQSNNVKPEQSVARPRSGKDPGILPSEKPPSNVLKQLENKHHIPALQQNVQPTKQAPGKPKTVPKYITATNVLKQRPQPKNGISAEELRESLVCLTQEQFQQILQTINQANKTNSQSQSDDTAQDPVMKEREEGDRLKAGEENSGTDENISATRERSNTVEQINTQNSTQPGDLFSTLGERERDKSVQEAKKAQWRKELDEQVALKKKLRGSTQDYSKSRKHEIHGPEYNGPKSVQLSDIPQERQSVDYSTPGQDDILFKTPTSTETSDSSPIISVGPSGRATSFSSPELPAAIRTAFVLGEVAPMDHPFSAIKRQQQKLWLEELNKQRDEVLLRKVQEKQKFLEAEEMDRWTMHFDSFKKQSNTQTQISDKQIKMHQTEVTSPELSEPVAHSTSPTPSYRQRVASEMLKSPDNDNLQSQKSGFVRTMTALLDPVQIEERDKKRLKQMEHQKAIAAQVEEKRKRKQQEEEQRRREEQEEEERLAIEREQIRKQFEEDAYRQKQKEEIISLKTKELYQSMQRAQEEAQRIKQEHRIRDLAQKGHDISKLQRILAGHTIHQDCSPAGSRCTEVAPVPDPIETNREMKQSIETLISPRKDTAVQTDVEMNTEFKTNTDETLWRDLQNQSPDIPIEFKDQQKADIQLKKLMMMRERSKSRKENKMTANDVYDQFARTESQVKENVRRPDWNKNKPSRKYVPASERYPKGLQKQREESKVRRQMELLHLVEKNNANNVQTRKLTSPERPVSLQEKAKVSHHHNDTKSRQITKKEEQFQKVESNFKRPDSPPVPAVKNRLQQNHKRATAATNPQAYNGNPSKGHSHTSKPRAVSPESCEQECERPPSSNFIPYVRTKEIYYLDPDAPMSRPSTHDPQYRREEDNRLTRQIFSSDHARDPLLNPGVVKNKDRQQAILKGLSELRKGLLQKQKELETSLIPDI